MERSEKPRRTYDSDFKKEAVRLVLESGRPLAHVARDLDIHENMLRAWKRQYLADAEQAFPGKGRLKPQEEELRRLLKETFLGPSS